MKAILSKKHYIQLIILETYLANGQVTVQQLEETTQATKQTILKQLNELENRGFFQVEKKKDHLLLRKNKPISYSEVYSYIYQDSVQLQFISLFFSRPFITTSEILKKLKISKSQFRRIKKQVADFLNCHDICLTDSPFYFTGDSSKLYQFFYVFFSEKYHANTQYILPKEQLILDQLLQAFTELPNFSTSREQQRLSSWIWVIIKLSVHIQKSTTYYKSADKKAISSATLPFDDSRIVIDYAHFKEVFKLSYTGVVQSNLLTFQSMMKEPKLSLEMQEKKQSLIQLTTELYQLFGENKEIELHYSIDQSLTLSGKIKYLLNDQKKRFVIEFFKQNGRFSAHTANRLLQKLITFRNEINDDPLFYEWLYLTIIYDKHLKELIRKNQQKKKIGLAFTYDQVHSELLITLLKTKLNEYAVFEIIDVQDSVMNDQNADSIDYWISNLPIAPQKNWLLLDNYPSLKEIRTLELLLQQSTIQPLIEALKKPLPTD